MRGYIDKDTILDLFDRLSYLEMFEAVAAVISETLPNEEPLDDADYYFTIYTIWNIIETNRK